MKSWDFLTEVCALVQDDSLDNPVVAWVDGNPREVTKLEYDEDARILIIKTSNTIGCSREE